MNIYRGHSAYEVSVARLLYNAIDDNDIKSVISLLEEKGANPNLVLASFRMSPFHRVIGDESSEFASAATNIILQYGGDPNVQTDEGLTTLHIAAAWGRWEILKMLLNSGGDPEAYDSENNTPIHYARVNHHDKCVDLITSYLPERSWIRQAEDCKQYKITLDKILVNNGTTVGEYEIISEYKTETAIGGGNLQTLKQLPEASAKECVMNWFSSHHPNRCSIQDAPSSTRISPIDVTTDHPSSSDSTLNESDNEAAGWKQRQPGDIAFRKRYRKTVRSPKKAALHGKEPKRNLPSSSATPCPRIIPPLMVTRSSPLFPKSPRNLPRSPSPTLGTNKLKQDSGVSCKTRSPCSPLRSPSPSTSPRPQRSPSPRPMPSHSPNIFNTYNWHIASTPKKELSVVKSPKSPSARSNLIPDLKVTGCNGTQLNVELDPDSENDFINGANLQSASTPTNEECDDWVSEHPEHQDSVNIFEKNIFDVTEDGGLANDDETSVKSHLTAITKSEGIGSSEASTVNVSEVYKYEDSEENIVLYETRLLKTSISEGKSSGKTFSTNSFPPSFDYEELDSETLRRELTEHGYNPGPITVTTKRVYLKKLKQLRTQPIVAVVNDNSKPQRVYSKELEKTLRMTDGLRNPSEYKQLDDVLVKQFSTPDQTRKWREGTNKSSFTYLLLDPRITNNLPVRAESMKDDEVWAVFISSIFYVGKGKRSRPYAHLYEAVEKWNRGERNCGSKKLQKILDIWGDNGGVVCLHIFQNTIPVEAYTREAAIISALQVDNLCNLKAGDFYGAASTWTRKQKSQLGVYLLYKALVIFLNEGERQLSPSDID